MFAEVQGYYSPVLPDCCSANSQATLDYSAVLTISTISFHDKFVEILLFCPGIIKIEQTLKPTGKQVAIINDEHLCLYGTGFIILISSWP